MEADPMEAVPTVPLACSSLALATPARLGGAAAGGWRGDLQLLLWHLSHLLQENLLQRLGHQNYVICGLGGHKQRLVNKTPTTLHSTHTHLVIFL